MSLLLGSHALALAAIACFECAHIQDVSNVQFNQPNDATKQCVRNIRQGMAIRPHPHPLVNILNAFSILLLTSPTSSLAPTPPKKPSPICPYPMFGVIVKILNLYIMLSCTHRYYFFPLSIHFLQCIHCLLHYMYKISM